MARLWDIIEITQCMSELHPLTKDDVTEFHTFKLVFELINVDFTIGKNPYDQLSLSVFEKRLMRTK